MTCWSSELSLLIKSGWGGFAEIAVTMFFVTCYKNVRFVVALLFAVCCCCGCHKAFVVVVAVVLVVVVVFVDKKSGWGV